MTGVGRVATDAIQRSANAYSRPTAVLRDRPFSGSEFADLPATARASVPESNGLRSGWAPFKTFQNAFEAGFRAQRIESGVHAEEVDRLCTLINCSLKPIESISGHAEGRVNRCDIKCRDVSALWWVQQPFELRRGIGRPARKRQCCRQIRGTANRGAGSASEFPNRAIKLPKAQPSPPKKTACVIKAGIHGEGGFKLHHRLLIPSRVVMNHADVGIEIQREGFERLGASYGDEGVVELATRNQQQTHVMMRHSRMEIDLECTQ